MRFHRAGAALIAAGLWLIPSLSGAADPATRQRRSQLPDLLRPDGAEGVQPGRLDPAFVLVSGGAEGFTAITEAEPGCAMGYWGIAMSHWYPLWFPPSPAALKAGSEAVEKAIAAGPKTEREKDYIAAIAAFYRDSDKLDHQTRAVAYEKAMEQVYPRYPRGSRGRRCSTRWR